MRADILTNLADVPAADWNALGGAGAPFLRHEFLLALETTGCVGAGTGWAPNHLALRDDEGHLVAAMPMYRKTDSFGEFVFDWSWADVYRRAGLRYYPKLVAGVPFTPATGQRLLVAPSVDPVATGDALLKAAVDHARDEGMSSLHVLFPTLPELERLTAAGFMLRKDCQFHWHNRGYDSFDGFLEEFTAEKRKKVRRERRRVAEAGITFRHYTGDELDADIWHTLIPLYGSSFWRRGRDPYLDEAFFVRVSEALPEHLLVIVALFRGEPVATAICFRSETTLYGRYWGSAGDFHSLHFETCYYQGIEYCIARGITAFEPGTQGEHKISRGFVPTETWSAHWLSHPQFGTAVESYLDRERDYIDRYIDVVRDHVPYRKATRD